MICLYCIAHFLISAGQNLIMSFFCIVFLVGGSGCQPLLCAGTDESGSNLLMTFSSKSTDRAVTADSPCLDNTGISGMIMHVYYEQVYNDNLPPSNTLPPMSQNCKLIVKVCSSSLPLTGF